MGFFYVIKIVQMILNRATHHIFQIQLINLEKQWKHVTLK